MKEVRIDTWCDRHDATGKRVHATHTTPPLPLTGKPLTLDLCDQCRTHLLTELTDLLHTHGADPDPTTPTQPATDGRVTCPEPGCNLTYTNRNTMAQHTRRDHHKGIRDYIAAGLLQPIYNNGTRHP